MDIGRMTNEDWIEFYKMFPQAAGFIQHRTLWNEYHSLKSRITSTLSKWEDLRLQELEVWYERTYNLLEK